MNAIVAPMDLAPADVRGDAFRRAMRRLAGGVSVITTGRGDERTGLTATSVSSLSADPPSVIVCVNRASSVIPVLREHQAFAVNLLAGGQRAIAESFAGRSGLHGAARYGGADWITLVSGAAILVGAQAALDCRLETMMDWHSHTVIIGRVEAVHIGGGAKALVYWRGRYVDLGAEG
jgi:flavin reductase (DIM6/NTAB) family NADH-FMN oxidoreductase RutF